MKTTIIEECLKAKRLAQLIRFFIIIGCVVLALTLMHKWWGITIWKAFIIYELIFAAHNLEKKHVND